MVIRLFADEFSFSVEYHLAYSYDLMDISALKIIGFILKNFFIGF